jgi:hypothetical protein
MESAQARRPRGYEEARREAPQALRAVPAPVADRQRPARRAHASTGAPMSRRTVEITGQGVAPQRRPRARRSAAPRANPDRLALWAVVLCLFMALVAAATARGDEGPPEPGGAPPAAHPAR